MDHDDITGHVVLSSSWRKRQHTKRRHKLEEDLGDSVEMTGGLGVIGEIPSHCRR